MSCTTQFAVTCKLDEGELNPTVNVINKGIEMYQFQSRPLRDSGHLEVKQISASLFGISLLVLYILEQG